MHIKHKFKYEFMFARKKNKYKYLIPVFRQQNNFCEFKKQTSIIKMSFCTHTLVLNSAFKNLVRLLRSHKSLVYYGEVT